MRVVGFGVNCHRYMCEGHDLWRSWWQAKQPNVVRAAWAVTTAAASFTWSDLGNARDDPYNSSQAFATYATVFRSKLLILAQFCLGTLPGCTFAPWEALGFDPTSSPRGLES
jgi:hypothetical protein